MYRDQGCGSCHRLAAAGSSGTAGPALDGKNLTDARVRKFVTKGGKGMLAYEDRISPSQVDAVVRFVVTASRAR